MKKLLTLALSIMLAATSLFVFGCDGNPQTSETSQTVVGKYFFYATESSVKDDGEYRGILLKAGDEYVSSYYGTTWTLSKESVVLEIKEDNTFKLSVNYGTENDVDTDEGIWRKAVDEEYENTYLLSNVKKGSSYNDKLYVLLCGDQLIMSIVNYSSTLSAYRGNEIILQK